MVNNRIVFKTHACLRSFSHLGPLKPLNPEKYFQFELNIPPSKDKIKKLRKKINASIKKKSEELDKTDLPPLTPPSDLIAIILRSVRDSDERLSRKGVYNILLPSSQTKPGDLRTLRMHIGFALTILERDGKLSKTGKGKIGDPYLYSSR